MITIVTFHRLSSFSRGPHHGGRRRERITHSHGVVSVDEFAEAVATARGGSRGRDRLWIGLGAIIGAGFLGIFGATWSTATGSTAVLIVALIIGAVVGGGIAVLVVRSRARRAAHLQVAARWAAANGWEYIEKYPMPDIDLDFLRQGDRRRCEDGARGRVAGHPAEIVNFTVEEESQGADGDRHVSRYPYFLLIIHREWAGPHLTAVRRSMKFGIGLRNAVRSKATDRQVVDMENDAFAGEFQVTLPDEWGKDVAFLLLPPDMQEQLVEGTLVPDVLQVDVTPAFLFLAWRKHFSAEDLPLLERRIADAERLADRWERNVPVAMRPLMSTPPPPAPDAR